MKPKLTYADWAMANAFAGVMCWVIILMNSTASFNPLGDLILQILFFAWIALSLLGISFAMASLRREHSHTRAIGSLAMILSPLGVYLLLSF